MLENDVFDSKLFRSDLDNTKNCRGTLLRGAFFRYSLKGAGLSCLGTLGNVPMVYQGPLREPFWDFGHHPWEIVSYYFFLLELCRWNAPCAVLCLKFPAFTRSTLWTSILSGKRRSLKKLLRKRILLTQTRTGCVIWLVISTMLSSPTALRNAKMLSELIKL